MCDGPRRMRWARWATLVLAACCCACAASESRPDGAGVPATSVSAVGETGAGGLPPQSVPAPAGAAPSAQPAAADRAVPQPPPTVAAVGGERGGTDDDADDRVVTRQRRRQVRSGAYSEFAAVWPGPAPLWPFEGLVQLAWGSTDERVSRYGPPRWFLRFYQWRYDYPPGPRWFVSYVELPGLTVECVGKTGLVLDGSDGLVVGGLPGAVSASYRVPWGGVAVELDAPPEALLDEIQRRPSNVAVDTAGDHVTLGEAEHAVRFTLREPARVGGESWDARARHDGDVAVVFVHPARHECFSGISWLIAAHSGEILACGADTAATRWVTSDAEPATPLVMPEADRFAGYLSCAFPLDPVIIRRGPPQ